MKKQTTKPQNRKLVLGREVVKELTALTEVRGGRPIGSQDNSHDCDSTQPWCNIISR